MVSFKYVAINSARQRIEGEIKAKDSETAVKNIQAQGNTIVSIRSAEALELKRENTLTDRLFALLDKIKNRVPSKNTVFFTRQLATMFSAGMTLERSLDMLSKGESHARFRKVLLNVTGEIKKGKRLSEALSNHPAVFSRLYVALIRSGEIGGTLGRILNELADHLEKSEDVKRKVVSALYYPVVVLIFLFCCAAFLILGVAPMFNKVYTSFGADLPAPTRILMNSSHFILDHFITSLFCFIGIIALVVIFSQTDRGKEWIDTLKLRIPVFGSLMKDSIMARFSRTFSLLMASSVPVLDSLLLVAHAMTNVIIEKAVLRTREGIMRGKAIYNAMEESYTFPDILIRLAETGEETGELDSLMLKGAEFYEKQVDSLIHKITSIIEPILIILMALVVGTLVIVIYLPIFYLGMAIKRGMH
jgi:type IV pilus assembly protein PilC